LGFRERLARRWGADLLNDVARQAADEATAKLQPEMDRLLGLAEAVGIDTDEHLYRSLREKARDLPDITHDEAIEVCFKLYQQDPLGHRVTELTRDFVVGDGISWSARNPDVEAIVADFWNDSVNDLDQRTNDFSLELGLYGELVPEAFVSDVAGVVQLGYIDPGDIKRVTFLDDGDIRNPLVLDAVWIKRKGSGLKGKELKIIRDRGKGVLQGDVFYFRQNGLSNSTRGWPDLLHIADWLNGYDQLLWELLERARLSKTFIWDVMVKGGETELQRVKNENPRAPRSGSIRYHNEGVEWKAVAPTLGSFETEAEAEVLLEHIAAGAGVAKTWLSSADDVNRATAVEMNSPVVRRLQRRQNYFLGCLRTMVRYALERAEETKRLSTEGGLIQAFDDDGDPALNPEGEPQMAKPFELVNFQAPEISPRDTSRGADVLTKLTNVCAIAEQQGWFGPETSRQILARGLQEVGYDFDPNEAPEEDDEPKDPKDPVNPDDVDDPKAREDLGEALLGILG